VDTQFSERLAVALVQSVQQFASACVGQGFEYGVHLPTLYATFWLHIKH
jgi:hypothetical protein